jgi:hypothetical protein
VLPFGLIKFLNLMPLQAVIIYVVQQDFRVRSFHCNFPNFHGRDHFSSYLKAAFLLVIIGTLIAFWNGPSLFELKPPREYAQENGCVMLLFFSPVLFFIIMLFSRCFDNDLSPDSNSTP